MNSIPGNFINSSDFPSTQNIGRNSGSVTLPGSTVVAGNGSYSNSVDIPLGNIGSVSRGRIASSKDSNTFYIGQFVSYDRFGLVLGFGALYTVYCFFWRVNETTVRLQVYVPNPYSVPLTGAVGDEIFSFYLNAFTPPNA